jgi:hypothetical protein
MLNIGGIIAILNEFQMKRKILLEQIVKTTFLLFTLEHVRVRLILVLNRCWIFGPVREIVVN